MPKARSKTRKKSTRRGASTPPITIKPDGTYTPSTGVEINPGGVVKFDVTFPPGTNTCYVPFGIIEFKQEVRRRAGGGGTIKVGSQ
jgi:hypothetical protein